MWDHHGLLRRGRLRDESRYQRIVHRLAVAGVRPAAGGPAPMPPARAVVITGSWSQLDAA